MNTVVCIRVFIPRGVACSTIALAELIFCDHLHVIKRNFEENMFGSNCYMLVGQDLVTIDWFAYYLSGS